MTEPDPRVEAIFRPVELRTARLRLSPVSEQDAEAMFAVLDDPALYTFLGDGPGDLAGLVEGYRRMAAGGPAPGVYQVHLIVRRVAEQAAVGCVDAVLERGAQEWTAELSWVIASAYQRRGYAAEAAGALLGWLREQGVSSVVAHIHPDHAASIGVARRLGLQRTADLVDGEEAWRI